MSPPLRTLGHNGPLVNAVGLGLMSIGGIYGAASSIEEGVAFLDHAYATGQRFWDTADMYLSSEEIVGEWIKRSGKRNDIFLATKFAVQAFDGKGLTIRSDPEYAKLACERSLKKLNVDTIDLYYCHRVDGVTPIEKTIEALVELKNEGKIRYIEYSPFALDIESPNSDILDTCRELGVAVVAYSPIGRGILTGQIKSMADLSENDFRRFLPKYSEENFPKILELVQGLNDVAKSHNSTSTQIAIAWLLAQGPDILPIPGTRAIARMDENSASAQIQLSDEEVSTIRELIKRTEVPGTRYPAEMMGHVAADTPAL